MRLTLLDKAKGLRKFFALNFPVTALNGSKDSVAKRVVGRLGFLQDVCPCPQNKVLGSWNVLVSGRGRRMGEGLSCTLPLQGATGRDTLGPAGGGGQASCSESLPTAEMSLAISECG